MISFVGVLSRAGTLSTPLTSTIPQFSAVLASNVRCFATSPKLSPKAAPKEVKSSSKGKAIPIPAKSIKPATKAAAPTTPSKAIKGETVKGSAAKGVAIAKGTSAKGVPVKGVPVKVATKGAAGGKAVPDKKEKEKPSKNKNAVVKEKERQKERESLLAAKRKEKDTLDRERERKIKEKEKNAAAQAKEKEKAAKEKEKEKEKVNKEKETRKAQQTKEKEREAEQKKKEKEKELKQKAKEQEESKKAKAREEREKLKKEKAERPKKPLSSYLAFANEIRPEIAEKNPTLKITEVLTEIGKRWGALTAEQKKKYEDQVSSDRDRYAKELKAYEVTHPRPPKRPATSFIVFFREIHEKTKQANPDASSIDIVKLIAKKWGTLTAEQKKPYDREAVKSKEKYLKERKAFEAQHERHSS